MKKCEWCDCEETVYVGQKVTYPASYCQECAEIAHQLYAAYGGDPAEWVGIRELAKLVKVPMKKLKQKLFELPMENVLVSDFMNNNKKQFKFHKERTIKWLEARA